MSTQKEESGLNVPTRKKGHIQRPSHAGLKLDGPHKIISDTSSHHSNSKATGPFFRKHSKTHQYDDKSVKSSSMRTTSNFVARPNVVMENSYSMEQKTKFLPGKVESIIAKVLEENLTSVTYESEDIGVLSRHIAECIKQQVTKLKMDRFKLITWVSICDKKSGDIQMSSRCLWDDGKDNFASAKFENSSLHAIGTVYAVYYE